ncbi:MAG: cation-transporting ATPase [Bacteroidetes bacterium B1(2017)]|nr:MAG: cation-transporting ATPase [Bacteroidetes bacterium B1(2017)]
MKTNKIVILLMLVLSISIGAFAQKSKTEKVTFKVYGNCGQCKERIENACDIKGVKAAEWDVDTKVMTVIFNPEKVTLEKIHEAIAGCGHDTDLKKSPDETYQKLPGCCLYREKPNTHHD